MTVSLFLLYGACVLGALGIGLALPRRGVSPQLLGALVAALGLGGIFLTLGLLTDGGRGLPNINFYVFSLVALGGALRVISHPRPVYAALYFVLTIIASAGLYVLLSAEFLAFALVIVYAGAILITYLFVIMLATETPVAEELDTLADYDRYSREPIAATVVAFVLVASMSTLLIRGSHEIAPAHEYVMGERIRDLPRKVGEALADAGLMNPAEGDHIARDEVGKPMIQVVNHPEMGGFVEAVTIEYGKGQRVLITRDNDKWPKDLQLTNVEGVGFALLADHPGAIEIAGVILLMAMLAAVVLARKKVELDEAHKRAAAQRKFADEVDEARVVGGVGGAA